MAKSKMVSVKREIEVMRFGKGKVSTLYILVQRRGRAEKWSALVQFGVILITNLKI
jgi:hypothetical protein